MEQQQHEAWVDYTRRNDPACPAGLERLMEILSKSVTPRVLCFWTKAPAVVASLYGKLIQDLQKKGTLVLAQVTLNSYYELEPGVKPEYGHLLDFVQLLGGPEYIRARFDPIIPGYTTLKHFKTHLEKITSVGIKYTTLNFLVPTYHDVADRLRKKGVRFYTPSNEKKNEIIAKMAETAQKSGVSVAVCAETAFLAEAIPGVLPAKCADGEWAVNLGVNENFKIRPSRKGCGCMYSTDWGVYPNHKQGYSCRHQCAYCYLIQIRR